LLCTRTGRSGLRYSATEPGKEPPPEASKLTEDGSEKGVLLAGDEQQRTDFVQVTLEL
jgi:hypothetical protein